MFPNYAWLIARSFKRVVASEDAEGPLRRYPALLLLYAIGLAAIASQYYGLVRTPLYDPVRASRDGEEPAAKILNNHALMSRDYQIRCFSGNVVGLSDHLFTVLSDPLRECLPDDLDYERAFDWFEYLLSLVHLDVQSTRAELQKAKAENPQFTLEAPFGRFVRKLEGPGGVITRTAIRADQASSLPAIVRDVLEAGFFESAGQVQMFDKYLDI